MFTFYCEMIGQPRNNFYCKQGILGPELISWSILDILFFINVKVNLILQESIEIATNQSVDWRNQTANQKPRYFKFCPRLMREFLLAGIQEEYPKERGLRKKIKSVEGRYIDLAIGIKCIQNKSFQLWAGNVRKYCETKCLF